MNDGMLAESSSLVFAACFEQTFEIIPFFTLFVELVTLKSSSKCLPKCSHKQDASSKALLKEIEHVLYPLHFAASQGNRQLCHDLFLIGCRANLLNSGGRFPYQCAADYGLASDLKRIKEQEERGYFEGENIPKII